MKRPRISFASGVARTGTAQLTGKNLLTDGGGMSTRHGRVVHSQPGGTRRQRANGPWQRSGLVIYGGDRVGAAMEMCVTAASAIGESWVSIRSSLQPLHAVGALGQRPGPGARRRCHVAAIIPPHRRCHSLCLPPCTPARGHPRGKANSQYSPS